MEKLRKPLESILFVSWCTPDDPCNIQISQQCASCRGMWEQQSKPSDLGWTGLHLGAARLGLDLPGPARILVLDCLFLLGAEVANDLLLERTVSSRGETAWKTKIRWVLSGKRALQPMEAAARNTSVAYCDVRTMEEQVERLWAVEELPFQRDKNSQPCFPMKKIEGRHEVGLMWKGVERPEDNRQSATAIAAKMAEKMDMRGSRESYESVLLDEYQQLEAIEAEPEPETEGYYLPHHAVIREEATTTKT